MNTFFVQNQLGGRRTIPVNGSNPQTMTMHQPLYSTGVRGSSRPVFQQSTYTTTGGQRQQYHRTQVVGGGRVYADNKPRQALSFIPAPVALKPLQKMNMPVQQYSYVPPRQPVVAPESHNIQLSLFGPSVGAPIAAPRTLTQTYSYIPPPTKSLMEEPAPQKKEPELNWMGITITNVGGTDMIEIHGTKSEIEDMRLHPKFKDVPVHFIDIDAPKTVVEEAPPEPKATPQASVENMMSLPTAKRVLFIDPEGVLVHEPLNSYGLNDEEVKKLVRLVAVLGPETKCVLTCGVAYRYAGFADKYYKGLEEVGLPLDGQTEPQNVQLGLKLVGPDAIDKSLYCILQLKANRRAEVRQYLGDHPDTDYALVQAWGGPNAYGLLSPKIDDDEMQPHVVQCNDGVDVATIYSYFKSKVA
eukprot:GEMP01028760.1.p1 GENE.GEMP01028760.1~~GEMP01028760.1.p1  ORF type:complete len:413 (+),score=78.91 GEMP01028760.1:60-1298(+)